MTTGTASKPALFSVAAATIALAGVNWAMAPDKAVMYGGVIGLVLAVVLIMPLAVRMLSTADERSMAQLRRASLWGCVIIAGSLAVALAGALDLLTDNVAARSSGIVIGLVLLAMGNVLPKAAKPLAERRCDPAKAQFAERWIGRTMVLAGLGYVGVWIALPVETAQWSSMLLALGAVVAALVLALRLWLSGRE